MNQDRVLRLIELIYDTAGDLSGWTPVLHGLVDMTRGSGADLAAFDLRRSSGAIHLGTGILDSEFQREYGTFAPLDPFLSSVKARRLFRAGVVGLGQDVVPLHELERTDFYHEFGKARDYVGGVSAIITADAGSGTAVSVSRRKSHLFGQREIVLMRTLMPHFQRAWHLHRRLVQGEVERSSFAAALNRLTIGTFIVRNGGTVVFANDSGREITDARDGLWLDRDTLRGGRPQDTAALNRLIASAFATASKTGIEPGGVLQLGRPSGLRPLRVIVSPLPASEKLAVAGPSVLIFVSDPEDTREPDMSILRQAHGLTRAEAEVAGLLIQDRTVSEIAELLGITSNTVRFHMKHLFSKTGTARQSALVRLMSATAQIKRR